MSVTDPQRRLPIDELNRRKQEARRYRAEWLLALKAGVVTLSDTIEQAQTEGGAPLGVLSMRDVLLTLGLSSGKANAVLRQTVENIGADEKPGTLKVKWFTGRQTSSRRLMSLADAMTRAERSAPTRSWPW